MHSEIFSKMPPTRLFFHCALPAMATSLAGGLYAIVDGIFVGRYLGAEALAAVNIVMPLIIHCVGINHYLGTLWRSAAGCLLHLGEYSGEPFPADTGQRLQ